MTIFNKTMQTVKDFDDIIRASNEAYRTARKAALETYREPMATEKIREEQEALTKVQIRETKAARDAVRADFADVRSMVNDMVTAAAPVDFLATLASVQAKGDRVTDYEANAYIEKYKDNYLAFSTILDVLHREGKAMDVIVYRPDAIEAQISEVENMVMNWIQNHAGSRDDGYITAILTNDKHSLIVKLAAEVQAFLDGGYVLGKDAAAKMDAELAGVGYRNT